MKRIAFPDGFLWGAATSAYQIEGGANEGGRGQSIWDHFGRTPGKISDGSTGDVACDHYRRWKNDIGLMKELGLSAYRFSVAWPRVIPDGRGAVNQSGLDFYSRLVDALLEAGIEPCPTLFHWDLPQNLQEAGGWANRATAEAFVDYALAVGRCLGDRVESWMTHNEPWCAAFLGYQEGTHAPGTQDWQAALAASHHLLLSHGWAVPVLRACSPKAEVGIVLNLVPVVPASDSAADAAAARHQDGHCNRWFLDPLYGRGYPVDMVADYSDAGYLPRGFDVVKKDDLLAIGAPTDFLGVNYYTRQVARCEKTAPSDNRPPSVFPDQKDRTDIDWEVFPDGLVDTLTRVHRDYKPQKLYVTENGAAYGTGPDENGRIADDRRIEFLRRHFLAAHRCIGAGVPLAGYFVWSLLDNFEWSHGYSQRFGLVWVDYETQERTFKDSARWYQQVIRDNGFAPHSQ